MAEATTAITQHFRPEEAPFIQLASDWIRQSEDEYRTILTPFLNPREQYILTTLVNRADDLTSHFDGGVSGAESQRAIIAPAVYEIDQTAFELAVLEINYPTKFTELHHAAILGALMHAGIKRAVVGDILGQDQRWQIIVDSKMLTYIQQTVTMIGRVKITWTVLPLTQAITAQDDWEETFTLLPSLRLDAVIAATFDISRSLAKTLITQQQVRLNWVTQAKPDHTVEVGDLISVRKYGRVKLAIMDGYSKKDKIKALFHIIHR